MANILVVEDDEFISSATAELIKKLGHTPFTAVSAESAQDILSQNSEIQLILLDVLLPGKDGVTWFGELQKAGNKIPVVFMSNIDQDEAMATAALLGAEQYLIKANTDISTLREIIEKHLPSDTTQ